MILSLFSFLPAHGVSRLCVQVFRVCGSGSTLVAGVKAYRCGIGIELDEKYYELACRRVRNAVSEPK